MSVPPPLRCPTCEGASVNPRNLVVFIDGTSHKVGPRDTNVVKLHNEIKTEREGSEPGQITHYLKGIGAYEDRNLSLLDHAGKAVYSLFEMAFALNVEKNVRDAYGWLARTYENGDKIYLFGFSRGAYQVRKLASMLHEIGLVKREHENQVDSAYGHYVSIDPLNPHAREEAMRFRRMFCRDGVRIHFVGVWDTVSSLGVIKRDIHVTTSTTVTNACHFRHALALDERRVKFLPEYFLEVNAYNSPVRSSRSSVGDVKEVWFPGCHSDVGGMSRLDNQGHTYSEIDDTYAIHAGNVPLLWIRQEAAANGLLFKPETSIWDPEDVDRGRRDTMTIWWKILEFCPIRHQISFSGIGKHKWRWHLSRTRSVIPSQKIHSSALSGDTYTPSATLRSSVKIPLVPRIASDELWTSKLPDEGTTTRLLISLLGNKTQMLESLEKVLFLIDSRLGNGHTQTIPRPEWVRTIDEQPDSETFVLTMIYATLWDLPAPDQERRVNEARYSLRGALFSNGVRAVRAIHVLRFSTKHEKLRRFFDHDGAIEDVVCSVERTGNGPSDNLFLLVMESLRYLIEDHHVRNKVINRLRVRPDGTDAERSRLYAALEVKRPKRLAASLKTVASLAQHQPDLRQGLEPKILQLAKVKNSPVGSAAIEALVALNVPLDSNIHFSNILSYLGNILPRLDAEVGGSPSPGNGDVPPIFQVEGSAWDKEKITHELVLTIQSRSAHERTAATLTLLKLCRNWEIRKICKQEMVVHTFIKQLENSKTSLLAAYALNTCLTLGMVTPRNFPRIAQLIVAMLDKGWFDDAVGRVEGRHILDGLMKTDIKELVVNVGMVDTLVKKLEGGEHHEVRMSLICLDILDNQVELTVIVEKAVANLTADDEQTRRKGVKVLAALAQTTAGEEAIKLRVTEIVNKLPSSSSGISSLSRSQIIGPAAALYVLCRNETLRDIIRDSDGFSRFKSARRAFAAQTRGIM